MCDIIVLLIKWKRVLVVVVWLVNFKKPTCMFTYWISNKILQVFTSSCQIKACPISYIIAIYNLLWCVHDGNNLIFNSNYTVPNIINQLVTKMPMHYICIMVIIRFININWNFNFCCVTERTDYCTMLYIGIAIGWS